MIPLVAELSFAVATATAARWYIAADTFLRTRPLFLVVFVVGVDVDVDFLSSNREAKQGRMRSLLYILAPYTTYCCIDHGV